MRMLKTVLGALLGGVLLVNMFVLIQADETLVHIEDVPTTSIALVFGGGMQEDGVTMSDLQTERVETAIALFEAGKVERLVMTGDDGARRVNEVDAMQAYAVERGVPDGVVETDPHGYNTYSSCYRAQHVYDFKRVVAISQAFHLPRIELLCEQFGVEVLALQADKGPYGLWGNIWGMHVREYLARVKAVLQLYVTQPGPISVSAP